MEMKVSPETEAKFLGKWTSEHVEGMERFLEAYNIYIDMTEYAALPGRPKTHEIEIRKDGDNAYHFYSNSVFGVREERHELGKLQTTYIMGRVADTVMNWEGEQLILRFVNSPHDERHTCEVVDEKLHVIIVGKDYATTFRFRRT